ncbi:MAG: hypothetical protein ACMG6H_12775, partial [Acidobacteriota bacterium]
MKPFSVAVLVLVSILSAPAYAKPVCKNETIEKLAKAVAEAYEGKTLASLDADRPYAGRVRIVIEHSLADDNARDRFVIKRFTSL